MGLRAEQSRPIQQDDVANYVATLTADLASIARQNGLDTLGYILDMARLEAENSIRQRRKP
jgi:hypothetical protein